MEQIESNSLLAINQPIALFVNFTHTILNEAIN